MDIETIIKIIKSVPADKLNDDEMIKTLMDNVAKQAGKTYTDDQLNAFVQQFKEFSQDKTPSSVISKLLYRGGTEDQIDEIKKKFDS